MPTMTGLSLGGSIEGIPKQIDFLIIGGGGAGGANSDGSDVGGGGAGGYTESFMTPASGITYTVIVGGGAAGSIFANPFNGIGTASSAFSVTAIGGGRGRSVVNGPAWQGASGNGGSGSGGGGTGGPASGLNGGPGATSTISLSSVARGGGGAGYGGSAGSGQGANTGSGGSGGVNYGGAGTSGVVLVKQLATERLPSVLTGTPVTYSNGTHITFMFTGSGSIGWS